MSCHINNTYPYLPGKIHKDEKTHHHSRQLPYIPPQKVKDKDTRNLFWSPPLTPPPPCIPCLLSPGSLYPNCPVSVPDLVPPQWYWWWLYLGWRTSNRWAKQGTGQPGWTSQDANTIENHPATVLSQQFGKFISSTFLWFPFKKNLLNTNSYCVFSFAKFFLFDRRFSNFDQL